MRGEIDEQFDVTKELSPPGGRLVLRARCQRCDGYCEFQERPTYHGKFCVHVTDGCACTCKQGISDAQFKDRQWRLQNGSDSRLALQQKLCLALVEELGDETVAPTGFEWYANIEGTTGSNLQQP